MGLRYSVNLYFRVEDIEKALLTTIALADIHPGPQPLKLRLPDGKWLELPFTSRFKSDPVELAAGARAELDSILLFPPSADLSAYFGPQDGQKAARSQDDQDYYALGMIDLSIECGRQFAELSYTAATSHVSRLFLYSQTVWMRFTDLLHSAGGIMGLLDIESYEYPLLENPDVRLTGEDSTWDTAPDLCRVDRMVRWMSEAKAHLLERWKDVDNAGAFANDWVIPFSTDLYPERSLELPPAALHRVLAGFAIRAPDVTDEVLDMLFVEPHWLYRCIGSCLAALTRNERFVPAIGGFLLAHQAHGGPYIFALLHIGTPQAADVLDRFLLSRLEPSRFKPEFWRYTDLDWALAALTRLDAQHHTDRAAKYTDPGGLWSSYADWGLQAVLALEEQFSTPRPELIAKLHDDWAEHIILHHAERALDFLEQAAAQYFA